MAAAAKVLEREGAALLGWMEQEQEEEEGRAGEGEKERLCDHGS